MVKVNENDQILNKIKSKHPIRGFSEEKPPKELIEKIIKVGMLTPSNAPAVDDVKDIRRFFIFEKGSANNEKLALLMKNKATDKLKHVESLITKKTFMKSNFQTNLNMLRYGVDKCVTKITTAPYFIIVSELRNISPAEQEPLDHVLENMRLKATALNLSFQFILLPCGNLSLISQMVGDEELMKLLGLPIKKIALNGCAIGYPTTKIPVTQANNLTN